MKKEELNDSIKMIVYLLLQILQIYADIRFRHAPFIISWVTLVNVGIIMGQVKLADFYPTCSN